MFWDKEKIIAVYETPEAIEGDPYIREPKESDKNKSAIDRETKKVITLWEQKLRFPYKTCVASKLTVVTNLRTLTFKLKLERDYAGKKSFIWNGQNIPCFLWSILGISKHSPEGLKASKWHDYLLYKKVKILKELKKKNIDINHRQYRRLTTLIFRELLKKLDVSTIKANVMAGAVGAWQFVSPQWWGVKDKVRED